MVPMRGLWPWAQVDPMGALYWGHPSSYQSYSSLWSFQCHQSKPISSTSLFPPVLLLTPRRFFEYLAGFSHNKKCFSFYNIWHSWKMGSSPVVADFQFFRQYLSCFCWSDQFWNLKLQYVAPYSKTSQCCIKKSTNHRTSNVESRSELQEGQQR